MDLLKALVAFGGRDVPEQRLVDALWPDAEGDTGHRAFKVNLHRLRKLLGGPERVLVARGRVSLERGSVWTDAAAFEDVVRRISAPTAAARNGDKPADWLAERLLDLYRGPFLDSEEIHGWVRAAREQQAAAFRRGVALLGEAWERAGRYDRALELYERALSVEPDHEGLFVGLMRCQLARGRPGDVLATFDRARHALEATFGTPPSDEAIALATRARNWPRQG